MISKKRKVVIIGAGSVGQACAFSMVNQKVAESYAFIDYFSEVAKGNAFDIVDAKSALGQNYTFDYGGYDLCADADIIIITAGTAQKPGQTRLELIEVNSKIMNGIIDNINQTSFKGIILIVSNPVDILTRLAAKKAKVGEKRVVGSGTSLDTYRLKNILADLLNSDSSSIESFVIGEHGNTSVFAYSATTIGGRPLSQIKEFSLAEINNIQDMVRKRAGDIINLKGSTFFGIGATVARIVNSILTENNQIFSLSVKLKGLYGNETECYAGTPATVSLSNGISVNSEVVLNQREHQLLMHSIETLNKIAKNLL